MSSGRSSINHSGHSEFRFGQQSHQKIAGMGNRGIGQKSFEIGLNQRRHVSQRHRQCRDDPQKLLPIVGIDG